MSTIGIRISAADQLRITKAVKAYMENEQIYGEVKLEFTNHYTYTGGGGETECGISFIEGHGVVQCPVNSN